MDETTRDIGKMIVRSIRLEIENERLHCKIKELQMHNDALNQLIDEKENKDAND